MLRFLFVAVAIHCFVSVGFAGPFGLDSGMSKTKIERLGVKLNAEEEMGSFVVYSTKRVPKSHSSFEKYFLIISPDQGLSKIVAEGTITSRPDGSDVKDAYNALKGTITKIYGEPALEEDYLIDGSIWGRARDWMMSLATNERVLETYWLLDPEKVERAKTHKIDVIGVKCLGMGAFLPHQAKLVLIYEFQNFSLLKEREDEDVF